MATGQSRVQRVTRLTLRESLKCARLRLWDEDRRTMIGWRELRETAEAAVPMTPATDLPLPAPETS